MAEANEKLQEQMESAPDGQFDIERVDEAQRVIEMVSVFPKCARTQCEGMSASTEPPASSGCGAGGTQRVRERLRGCRDVQL